MLLLAENETCVQYTKTVEPLGSKRGHRAADIWSQVEVVLRIRCVDDECKGQQTAKRAHNE